MQMHKSLDVDISLPPNLAQVGACGSCVCATMPAADPLHL